MCQYATIPVIDVGSATLCNTAFSISSLFTSTRTDDGQVNTSATSRLESALVVSACAGHASCSFCAGKLVKPFTCLHIAGIYQVFSLCSVLPLIIAYHFHKQHSLACVLPGMLAAPAVRYFICCCRICCWCCCSCCNSRCSCNQEGRPEPHV